MNGRTVLAGALGVLLGVEGCAPGTNPSDNPTSEEARATIQPIIGGVEATSYPEAVSLDMRSTDGSGYACSAVLIAPRVVLTAGHCVDGMASWVATANGQRATSTHGETYDWHENGATTVNPLHHDIGLVYLDSPISLDSYPTLASAPVPNDTQVTDVGRIDNGVLTDSLYSTPVNVGDGAALGYSFDYFGDDVIEHGDSGGPVFLPSTHTVLAVNSGANTVVEVLARVDLLAPWIADRVAAMGQSAAVAEAGGGSEAGAEVEAGAASDDAGDSAPSEASAPDAGDTEGGACTQEVEPNDRPSQADPLADLQCGSLDSATDVDFYVLTPMPGTTHVVLASTSDAVVAIGYVTAPGTCTLVVPASAKSTGVTVTVTGSQPVPVCLAVSSPGQLTQSYTLSVTH